MQITINLDLANPCERELIETAKYLMSLAKQDVVEYPVPAQRAAKAVDVTAQQDDGRDTTGVYYDPKIHSRTKSKNPDGTWKMKRVAEPVIMPLPDIIQPPVAPPVAVPLPVAPITQPVASQPVQPPHPKAPQVHTFNDFMTRITADIMAGKITQPVVLSAIQEVGLVGILDLGKRDDLVDVVMQKLGYV